MTTNLDAILQERSKRYGDFRALCAELLRRLDENRHPEVRYPGHLRIQMARARAELAKPEPVRLTDEELLRTYGKAKRDYCHEGPLDDWHKQAERAATVHGLRAVLALISRPTTQPTPVSERPILTEGSIQRGNGNGGSSTGKPVIDPKGQERDREVQPC
jgi:hypothetical protein